MQILQILPNYFWFQKTFFLDLYLISAHENSESSPFDHEQMKKQLETIPIGVKVEKRITQKNLFSKKVLLGM